MEWAQLLIMIVTLGGLFLWNRAEANSDRRMFYDLLKGMETDMRNFQATAMQETKDFHGRLISLEEKRKQ